MLGRRSHGWTGLLVMGVVGWTAPLSAQTARDWGDQIWEGTAEISVPRLVWKTERPTGSRIETAGGLKLFVPVQVWFWAKTNSPTNAMMICINSRKLGNDPVRTELTGVLGQLTAWGDSLLRNKPRGRALALILGDESAEGTYTLARNNTTATFRTINIDSGSGRFVPLPRRVLRLEGSFRKSGAFLSGAAAVTSPGYLENFWGQRGRDEQICVPSGTIRISLPRATLTTQKPSAEQISKFARFRDAQDLYP